MKEVRNTSYQVVQSYTYTPAGLMWGETHGLPPNQWTTAHIWDTDGNRVRYEPIGVYQAKRWFVHDVTAGVPARVVEVAQTGTPNLAYTYFYREPDGSLIAMFTPPEIIPPAGPAGGGATSLPDGTWRFYHFDGLGSSRALTDGAGAVTDRYTYDAWGNVQHTYGSTSQPFQFVGRLGYFKHEYGFQPLQLGVRLHDPQVGRFTQRDPVRGNGNGYLYAQSMPTVAVDPSGEAWYRWVAVAVGVAAVALGVDWWHWYYTAGKTAVHGVNWADLRESIPYLENLCDGQADGTWVSTKGYRRDNPPYYGMRCPDGEIYVSSDGEHWTPTGQYAAAAQEE